MITPALQVLSKAVVHFVGIVAFTVQSTPYPTSTTGIPVSMTTPTVTAQVASLNRLPAMAPVLTTPANLSNVVAILPHNMLRGIPKHKVMILFRACDYLGSTGWNPADLGRDGLLYVELDHDSLTFDSGGAADEAVKIPPELPHSRPAALAASAPYGLVSDYKPPRYPNATVFQLYGGTASVCQTGEHRYDTTVVIKNQGQLTLRSTTSTRTLKLNGNAHVSIENVPFETAQLLRDPAQPTNGPMVHHYVEYCAMAGINANDPVLCVRPQPRPDGPTANRCANDGEDMLVAQLGATPSDAKLGDSSMDTMGMSADCSNTAWP